MVETGYAYSHSVMKAVRRAVQSSQQYGIVPEWKHYKVYIDYGLFGGPVIIRHLILRVPKKGTITLSTAHISIVSASNISMDISFHPKPKTWAAAAGNQEVGSLVGT